MKKRKFDHGWELLRPKDRPVALKNRKGNVWECVFCGVVMVRSSAGDPNLKPDELPKNIRYCKG